MGEIEVFLDDVANKFGYSKTLTDDLKRIVPLMLKGKDETKKQMMLDTLSQVKIFVLPEDASLDDLEQCKAEVFDGDNQGVTFEEADMGEYSKKDFPAGAYVSEPVFDDDMNIIGRNRMLYVKELSKYSSLQQVYGSNINLSHLIHELGHAWAAQTNEYIENENGTFVQNVGACSISSRVDKDKKIVTGETTDGLFIEETLNTIQEEKVLLELTEANSISELTSKGYVRSSYQGMQTDIMKSYVEKFGTEVFEEYRYSKDGKVLSRVEQLLSATEAWEILRTAEYTKKKKAKITEVENLAVSAESISRIKSLFEEYHDVYFPDNSSFTPMQKLNNVLEQLYNFNSVKYNFNIMGNDDNLEIYKGVVSSIVSEANALRFQAKDIDEPDSKDFINTLKTELQPPQKVAEYYAKDEQNQFEKDENTIEDK